jgi:hypothetical protein
MIKANVRTAENAERFDSQNTEQTVTFFMVEFDWFTVKDGSSPCERPPKILADGCCCMRPPGRVQQHSTVSNFKGVHMAMNHPLE